MKLVTAVKMLLALARGREDAQHARYVLADSVTRAVYPEYVFSEFGRLYLRDTEFRRLNEAFDGGRNLHALDRRFALDQLVQLVQNVEGDTAECGVFRGASSYLICRRTAGSGRLHHVFDSFDGLSSPASADGAFWQQGDLRFSEEAVSWNLREFGDAVRLHKGWIPDRFADVADRRFAFVHVDVDLYQPTLDSVAFFYERLNPGGLLVCDDYGFSTCPGARAAMDQFFADKVEPIVSLPTGQGLVLRQSPRLTPAASG